MWDFPVQWGKVMAMGMGSDCKKKKKKKRMMSAIVLKLKTDIIEYSELEEILKDH